MRSRTAAVLAALLLVLAGVAGGAYVQERRDGVAMTVAWVSDTARETAGNHHAPAAAVVDGEGMVFAPVSGRADTDGCALVALDATDGDRRWGYAIPPADCTIHSVADPTVADYDRDGTREILAATTENELVALDPSGAVELRYGLSSYGYTRPVVADLVGDDRPEIVVVDVAGTVSVLRGDGKTVWTRQLGTYTWGQPTVADVDGDDDLEVAVGAGGSGELHLFEADGTPAWETPVAFEGSITWMATGQVDEDDAAELVVATASGGTVAAVDGDGSVVWSRDLGSFAAVHAVADGDADDTPEVYAVAKDGVLRALAADTGAVEWETTLTDASVQMTPPPAVGDVDGDGALDVVAVTNDGVVSLVDPESGAVRATYERDDAIYTHPTLADVDGDGDDEAFVMYARGRVVAFDFSGG